MTMNVEQITTELKSGFAYWKHPEALPIVETVLNEIESYWDISEYWRKYYLADQLAVSNMLHEAQEIILRGMLPEESIPFKIGDKVKVPKGGQLEDAKVIGVDPSDRMCEVLPDREGAEVFRVHVDLLYALSQVKKSTKIAQMSLF